MSKIISHPTTPEYREGWERIFGKPVHISELLDTAMEEIRKSADNAPEDEQKG